MAVQRNKKRKNVFFAHEIGRINTSKNKKNSQNSKDSLEKDIKKFWDDILGK